MTTQSAAALTLVGLLLSRSIGMAASKPVEVKWGELGSLISGHTVKLTFPGGVRVKGYVAEVREDALAIEVRKTSDAKTYPRGALDIPRASVTTLEFERSRGPLGRTIGILGGFFGGASLGGSIANAVTNQRDGANMGIVLLVGFVSGVAGAVAGHYIGKAADRRVTIVRVVP